MSHINVIRGPPELNGFSHWARNLIPLRDEALSFESHLIVITPLVGSRRQLHLRSWSFLVRNQAQEMSNAIKSRLSLAVRPNDEPGGVLAVCGLQHRVSSPRIVIPTAKGFQVHRAEFPLSKRVLDARFKPPLMKISRPTSWFPAMREAPRAGYVAARLPGKQSADALPIFASLVRHSAEIQDRTDAFNCAPVAPPRSGDPSIARRTSRTIRAA